MIAALLLNKIDVYNNTKDVRARSEEPGLGTGAVALFGPDDLAVGKHQVDPRILAQLRGAKKITAPMRCLECGYFGAMPLLKEHYPWYGKVRYQIILLLTVVGIVFVLLLSLLAGQNIRRTVRCPNCNRTLITKA